MWILLEEYWRFVNISGISLTKLRKTGQLGGALEFELSNDVEAVATTAVR
jgi:hypothetical protein